MSIRPAPPCIFLCAPPCSLCGEETSVIDSRYQCERCRCSWDIDEPDAPGEWDEPDAPRCPETIQSRFRGENVRCLLDAGHRGNWHHAEEIDWTGAPR